MKVGDLVWVKFPGLKLPERKKITRWILGFIVDLAEEQRGHYKIHLFEFDIACSYFINDIRILEEKTTIYEKEVVENENMDS